MRDAEKVHLTCDSWSSPNSHSFLAIAAHWIGSDWEANRVLLKFIADNRSHTGANLASHIQATIEEYDIVEKLGSVTTDSAANNIRCMKELDKTSEFEDLDYGSENHHRCLAHVFNIAVQAAIVTFNEKTLIIEKVRKIVTHVNSSPQRFAKFTAICAEKQLNPTAFSNDMLVRWGSTFNMLNAFIQCYAAVNLYVTEMQSLAFALRGVNETSKQSSKSTEDDDKIEPIPLTALSALKSFVEILKIFDKNTTHVSKSTFLISNATLMLGSVLDYLNDIIKDRSRSENLRLSATSARDKLAKYYVMYDQDQYGTATILDPSLKLSGFAKFKWSRENKIKARQSFDRCYKCYQEQRPRANDLEEKEIATNSVPKESSSVPDFYEIINTEEPNEIKDEASIYLKEAVVKSEDKPAFIYWKENAKRFPILASMAKNYLAIPITSVDIERDFSTGRRVIPYTRAKLAPETITAIMLTQDWRKLQ